MQWTFRDDAPIYLQLIEQLRLKIVSGEYPPGCRLPGVREPAAEAGINPNTVQRAMAELERMGLAIFLRIWDTLLNKNAEGAELCLMQLHWASF